jgi:hypothetical protein
MIGHVSAEDLGPMLDDKKEMLEILDSIQLLCPKIKSSRTSNTKAPKLPSREQDAPLESPPRGPSRKKQPDTKSEDVVKICIKVWLEVYSSILLLNDAYNCISQESLV